MSEQCRLLNKYLKNFWNIFLYIFRVVGISYII